MDFLKNAAKIAQEVQGKRKPGGEGSGGLGGLAGFMGGDGNQKHKYDEQRPHGYGDEMPHNSQPTDLEHKKKPSTGDLFASAQVRSSPVFFFSWFFFLTRNLCFLNIRLICCINQMVTTGNNYTPTFVAQTMRKRP